MIEASGKLHLVDKLIKKIVQQKEQVLIFSGFTATLDIIEDYCTMRQWTYSRLDGSTSLDEREQGITEFVREGTSQ